MDPGSTIGIVVALIAIFASMIMEGGNPAAILLPPAMIIVFGGTIGATLACGMISDFVGAMKAVVGALFTKKPSEDEATATVVSFADKARREGLLALEQAARDVEDPFLKKGIELAVDGTDPEELRDIMEADITARRVTGKAYAKVFNDMGGFAPTFGIIGTVLGLIHVLENLSEPEKLGHLISGAFVATLWGVLTANAIFLPLGKKLARVHEEDVRHMELIVEGVLSVQAGSNPRLLEQKLHAFLGQGDKVSDKKAA